MDISGYRYLGILYQIFLLFPSSSTVSVELQQTIPANSFLVCPGEKLQYTCWTYGNSLGWQIPDQPSMLFDIPNDVNTTRMVGQFELTLTELNGAGYISTATNSEITSDFHNEKIGCSGGTTPLSVTIAVADGPANCSDVAVTCKATPNSANDSETDILVFLSTNSTLMCVVAYQIQFNEQNVTVPASSPLATFIINEAKGQPFLDEKIYTLDYENRTGKVPCLFSIPKPSGVENITIKQECETTSQNLSVTFSWKPSEIGGCLDEDNITLEYIIECNSIYSDNSYFMTSNTNYMLLNVPQGTDLEITVTPILRDLGLKGSPLSTAEHVVNTSCLASSSSTTNATTSQTTLVTSTTTSLPTSPTVSPAGETGKNWILPVSVIGPLALIAVLVICFGVLICACRPKKAVRKAAASKEERAPKEVENIDLDKITLGTTSMGEEQLLHQNSRAEWEQLHKEKEEAEGETVRDSAGAEQVQLQKEREEVEKRRLQDEREKIEQQKQITSKDKELINKLYQQIDKLENDRKAKDAVIKGKDAEIDRLKLQQAQQQKAWEQDRKAWEQDRKAWKQEQKTQQEMFAKLREDHEKQINQLQEQINTLKTERDEQRQAQLKDEEKIDELSRQIEAMRAETKERDQELKKKEQEQEKKEQEREKKEQEREKKEQEREKKEQEREKKEQEREKKEQEREKKEQERDRQMKKLLTKSGSGDEDNQSKEYSDPVLEEHAEQGQFGTVKNHSQHLSDSGLPNTATEGDTDTQDGYGNEAVMQSSQHDVRPGGQSGQLVLVPSAQPISSSTYSSTGDEIVPGQTVSNGHSESEP